MFLHNIILRAYAYSLAGGENTIRKIKVVRILNPITTEQRILEIDESSG